MPLRTPSSHLTALIGIFNSQYEIDSDLKSINKQFRRTFRKTKHHLTKRDIYSLLQHLPNQG